MNFNNFRNISKKQNVVNENNNYNLEVSKEDVKVEFVENKNNINTMFLNNKNNFQKEENFQRNYENIPPLRTKYKNNLYENNMDENNIYQNNINNISYGKDTKLQHMKENFNDFYNKDRYFLKDKLNNADKLNKQIYYNYLENNLNNLNKKRPESLANKFPIMTDKILFNNINNDSSKNNFDNKKIIEMLENSIINKIKKINYYNNLLQKIEQQEEKTVLNEIKLDKQKHEKLLLDIYKTIAKQPKENFANFCHEENIVISENLKKEYKKCISLELNSIEFFKRLYFIVENTKIKNLLYEIIIDTVCSSLKLNYCALNY